MSSDHFDSVALMDQRLLMLLTYYPVFLISLTIHEFSHGFVALRKGDDTAKLSGRLTLNPIAHIDPIGTVFFPIFSILFGGIYFAWAKPVPVNPLHFKDRRRDMFWVSLAGPLSNFIFAFFSAWIYGLAQSFGGNVFDEVMKKIILDLSHMAIYLNLSLFFFNLIPISPLDGAKVLARFLPEKANHFLESIHPLYGGMILMFLLISGLMDYIAIPIFTVGHWMQGLFIF